MPKSMRISVLVFAKDQKVYSSQPNFKKQCLRIHLVVSNACEIHTWLLQIKLIKQKQNTTQQNIGISKAWNIPLDWT